MLYIIYYVVGNNNVEEHCNTLKPPHTNTYTVTLGPQGWKYIWMENSSNVLRKYVSSKLSYSFF